MARRFTAYTEFYRPLETPEDIEEFLEVYEKEDPEFKNKFTIFAGRSNVGKSSLINSLFTAKIAKTSKTPGRTQAINIFKYSLSIDGEQRYFMDLPGFGYAKVSKEMRKKWDLTFSYFFNILPRETVIFHIQDARHPFTEVDRQFLSFLGSGDFDSTLIFNKFDKLKAQKLRAALDKDIRNNPNFTNCYQNIIKCSAEKKEGLEPITKKLVSLF